MRNKCYAQVNQLKSHSNILASGQYGASSF